MIVALWIEVLSYTKAVQNTSSLDVRPFGALLAACVIEKIRLKISQSHETLAASSSPEALRHLIE